MAKAAGTARAAHYVPEMAPWKHYRLKTPSRCRLGDGRTFRVIHHVTHATSALRILEDGLITPSTSRELGVGGHSDRAVTWLAPNDYKDGSRYGTVRFSFDFEKLTKRRKIYWVLGADNRQTKKCVLLITDQDVGDLPVRRYYPRKSKGPLRLVDGTWMWRPDVSLKIIVDHEIPLTEAVGFDFIEHHHGMCSLGSHSACEETGKEPYKASARVLAGMVSHRLRLPAELLVDKTLPAGWLQWAKFYIEKALGPQDDKLSGPITRRDDVDVVLGAALTQLAAGLSEQAAQTAALIGSDRKLEKSLQRLVDDWTASQLPASACDRSKGSGGPAVSMMRQREKDLRAIN